MIARNYGKCSECGEEIRPGQEITWNRKVAGVRQHVDCFRSNQGGRALRESSFPHMPTIATISSDDLADETIPVIDDASESITYAPLVSESRTDLRAEINAIVQQAFAEYEASKNKIEAPKDFNEDVHENFKRLAAFARLRMHCYLWGEPGSGKSYTAEQVARFLGLKYRYISLSPQTQDSRLIGYMDYSRIYHKTPFREMYEEGGVFCIDEADNAAPQLLTTLNSMLENDWGSFPDGMVRKSPNFICILTGNTNGRGHNPAFPHRQYFDAAFSRRFVFIEWNKDAELEMKIALKKNPEAIKAIRWIQSVNVFCKERYPKVIVSPGETLKLVHAMQDEDTGTFEQLAESIIWKGFDRGSIQTILNACPYPAELLNGRGNK